MDAGASSAAGMKKPPGKDQWHIPGGYGAGEP